MRLREIQHKVKWFRVSGLLQAFYTKMGVATSSKRFSFALANETDKFAIAIFLGFVTTKLNEHLNQNKNEFQQSLYSFPNL